MGNSEAILATGRPELADFPELATILNLHLCDAHTGTPMHALANGWYFLRGGGTAAQAANALHCDVSELPELSTFEHFDHWVIDVLEPRWQAAANRANDWIDAHANEVDIPSEQHDEPEFQAALANGLHVSAKLVGEGHRDKVGPYYRYAVIITDGSYVYETEYGGSVFDHMSGIVNARQAGWGTLHELCEFVYRGAKEFADDLGEAWNEMNPEMQYKLTRCEHAANAMREALEANGTTIGTFPQSRSNSEFA